MKKYELTQYEFVKVRVDHKPIVNISAEGSESTYILNLPYPKSDVCQMAVRRNTETHQNTGTH